jgi:hypothetical protein
MAKVSVPVALVSKDAQCTRILEVSSDGMSTISEFQRQLAVGLLKKGMLVGDVRFRGNPLLGDSRLHHFTAAHSGRPKFTAAYTLFPPGGNRQLFFVKTATGKIISLEHK